MNQKHLFSSQEKKNHQTTLTSPLPKTKFSGLSTFFGFVGREEAKNQPCTWLAEVKGGLQGLWPTGLPLELWQTGPGGEFRMEAEIRGPGEAEKRLQNPRDPLGTYCV